MFPIHDFLYLGHSSMQNLGSLISHWREIMQILKIMGFIAVMLVEPVAHAAPGDRT